MFLCSLGHHNYYIYQTQIFVILSAEQKGQDMMLYHHTAAAFSVLSSYEALFSSLNMQTVHVSLAAHYK